MIRNLKILFAAAMALAAFGAVTASGAQAAEEFHCSVEPCTITALPDGTGKTAHHVFEFHPVNETTEIASFTCNTMSGSATMNTKTATEITLANIVYSNCWINGSPGVTLDMNGCTYTYTSTGGATDNASFHILCPAGKSIQLTVPGGCTFSIAPQTPTKTGVGYKNEGPVGSRVITVTTNTHGIHATASGCSALIKAMALEMTYTTGNTLLTGETHAGAMADLWFE